jgi:hypothetical protein
MKFRATSDFAGQTVQFNYRQKAGNSNSVSISDLASNTVKAARQRTSGAEDELKRAQSGGGIMGNNLKFHSKSINIL